MFLMEKLSFDWRFYVLPVIVGALSGLGAVVFRQLISFVQNLFFKGTFAFSYDEAIHVIDPAYLVIIVPVVGFAIVGILVFKGAPETQGHGVPEVLTSVYINKGRIRARVAAIKTVASALTIGSGGSSGREGPIVQIGASIGSVLGQRLNLTAVETTTLLGCGAAAGIASTFNAPLGGILFAIELILPEFSVRTMVPLALSTSTGTYLSRFFLGNEPAFRLPEYALNSGYELILYILLGVFIGIGAIIYIHVLYKFEDFFEQWNVNKYLKPVVGGLIMGLSGYLMLTFFGEYYIFGVGYPTISSVLSGGQGFTILLLLLLAFMKIFATSVTLGCGGSGGIFAPALFIGTCFGAAFGIASSFFFPELVATPSAYANVGMGAFVGGITGAPLMAIIMFFEMTRNYAIILPLTISVVIARAFVHYNYEGTIYELKLLRNGIKIPHERAIDTLSIVPIKDIMDKYNDEQGLPEVYHYAPMLDALMIMDERRVNELIVVDKTRTPIGVIRKDDIIYFYTRERANTRRLLD
ncbi:MAG TPA: chloride channel protein [Methanomicrobia archaeon]|nr:chloride channel protein [Methanomicrobia archaeon]